MNRWATGRAVGGQDGNPSAGRRELLEQTLRGPQLARWVDILGEGAGGMLRIGDEGSVEGSLKLIAEDNEHTAAERHQRPGQQPGVDKRQTDPDRRAPRPHAYSFST